MSRDQIQIKFNLSTPCRVHLESFEKNVELEGDGDD